MQEEKEMEMEKDKKSLILGVRFNKTVLAKMDKTVKSLNKRKPESGMSRNKLINQAVVNFLLERDREML